jgi:hypothetical protein
MPPEARAAHVSYQALYMREEELIGGPKRVVKYHFIDRPSVYEISQIGGGSVHFPLTSLHPSPSRSMFSHRQKPNNKVPSLREPPNDASSKVVVPPRSTLLARNLGHWRSWLVLHDPSPEYRGNKTLPALCRLDRDPGLLFRRRGNGGKRHRSISRTGWRRGLGSRPIHCCSGLEVAKGLRRTRSQCLSDWEACPGESGSMPSTYSGAHLPPCP